MSVSVDYLVKDRDCAVSIKPQLDTDLDELIAFRLEANVNTYAAFRNEVDATRPASHDFRYENGKYIWVGHLCYELYGTSIEGWFQW